MSEYPQCLLRMSAGFSCPGSLNWLEVGAGSGGGKPGTLGHALSQRIAWDWTAHTKSAAATFGRQGGDHWSARGRWSCDKVCTGETVEGAAGSWSPASPWLSPQTGATTTNPTELVPLGTGPRSAPRTVLESLHHWALADTQFLANQRLFPLGTAPLRSLAANGIRSALVWHSSNWRHSWLCNSLLQMNILSNHNASHFWKKQSRFTAQACQSNLHSHCNCWCGWQSHQVQVQVTRRNWSQLLKSFFAITVGKTFKLVALKKQKSVLTLFDCQIFAKKRPSICVWTVFVNAVWWEPVPAQLEKLLSDDCGPAGTVPCSCIGATVTGCEPWCWSMLTGKWRNVCLLGFCEAGCNDPAHSAEAGFPCWTQQQLTVPPECNGAKQTQWREATQKCN